MRLYIITLSVLSVVLLAVSCQSDFLLREPTTSVATTNYFNTEAELELYANGFYAYARGITITTDLTGSDNVEVNAYNSFLAGVRTVPASGGGWTWTTLRSINYFLANYRKADVSEDVLNYYGGFAKFFRAWFYFDKLKLFGDVPWYSMPLETNSPELYNPRDSRTLIADSILVDLDNAIAYLGEEKNPAIITKWTALALKSRFCLYEGTYRRYHTELGLTDSADRFLEECAEASYKLITESGYKAYYDDGEDDYMEMFITDIPNSECIFSLLYDRNLNMVHSINNKMLSVSQYGGAGMTRQMVESYLMLDGGYFSAVPGSGRMTFAEECRDRDKRLAQTIRTPGYKRIGTTKTLLPDFDKASTGYQIVKYVTGPENDAYEASTNALPVYRYSEVLLNYAEAMAELGTITQYDIDLTLNKTRKRGGLPNLVLADVQPDPAMQEIYPGITNAILLEIRRERRIELAFEGLRWDDLMRWKRGPLMAQRFKGMYIPQMGLQDLDGDGINDFAALKTAPAAKDPNITYLILGDTKILTHGTYGHILPQPFTVKTFDEQRDYLYPIPLNELTINKNLTQNPGWNF